MQRGQRGERDRSLRRNASNRGQRSIPSNETSQSSSSHALPRRSARIAELLHGETHHRPVTTTSSMADVARPRMLGSRSVRPRHHTGNTHIRSRSGRHSILPEDIRYAMDIVVQPPQTARAGQTIPGCLIVRLRTTNADPDDAVADSSNFMAVATLAPGPNPTTSSDSSVSSQLLAGQCVDTIHPFADDEADGSIASMDMADQYSVGYMRFPNLVIRQAGTFRVKVTLIRTGSTGNGSTVQIVHSNPIAVYGNGSTPELAAYNGKYMVATY